MVFRKLFILILPAIIVAQSSFAALSLPAYFPENVALSLNSPKDISKFLKKHFEFEEDPELFGQVDYWQSPEEFWKKRAGDCEDFAIMSNLLLKVLGYESQIVSIYGANGYAHTVTIFKNKNHYHVMNEGRLYSYKAKSLSQAIGRVYGQWTWAAIAERKETRGWLKQRITNPRLNKPAYT